jgi:hydroxypyruvate isomerase
MPNFAANLSMMFNEWPFLERFEAAADAGFRAVEYLFPYDHPRAVIAQRLKANNLTQALFNLPPGDWSAGDRGLAAIAGRQDEFRASVATALDYAEAIGVKRLHVMAGIAQPQDTVAMDAYRDSVAFAADAAAVHGIDLLIEPINGRDMPGYFLNDFGAAVRLIEELNRPNLKLQFDIYHRQIMHGDVLKSLASLMPIIGHVQIASVPFRNEPDTGELNDYRILAELDRLGYQGFVGCESRPAGDTRRGLSWIQPWRDPHGNGR